MSEAAEQELVESIKMAHTGAIGEAQVLGPKLVSVNVKRENLLDVSTSMRDKFGFTHPVSAGGVDWLKENRTQVIYYVLNPDDRIMLMLSVDLPRDGPRLESLTKVWDAMNFHEREAREMFGIEFDGHPNPVNLLLPPDWKGGHPLRKDFKGEGVSS